VSHIRGVHQEALVIRVVVHGVKAGVGVGVGLLLNLGVRLILLVMGGLGVNHLLKLRR